ncbi:DNA polymerase III subunit gamma/tau [Nitrosococcus wardiae]|uniref:DNA polymerase III subunit gamma/tau n=1 Tax=Nitrosococcus wardiae TaxID=1814290 RepID=A0A4P7BUH9_9GAMM|nr:DNA polymerase III subunit gamma/tau [Nitrosococcus wardiae]QBQ53603.1 DNA polymerase III subunit gamma/tau [Nitrosococcus wardiae]
MSYQVLARKWRPRNFTQLVGQEHVVRALINSLDNDRLHHAFLFTGTRGVGKTTLARILAKSLNCEEGVGSTPCGHCQNCRAIDAGNFVDLIEVDAASRTGVDDTRELLENVHYAPSRGRYKVYLIDEVHMFSTSSFNALLKTLEEPPPHIKFLLATTNPKKLPVTVLSRCLQFNLRRITPETIASHLDQILTEEQVPSEFQALTLIARAAEGSMRDALSLLDQAISYGGGQVMTADVRIMLGSIEQRDLLVLLDALLGGNGQELIGKVREICDYSVDIPLILADLLHLLQRLALYQFAPDTVDDIDEREAFHSLATRMTPEDVQLFYQIGLIGNRDLAYAPDPRAAFEMVLLRMLCFHPVNGDSLHQTFADDDPKQEKTRSVPPTPPPVSKPRTPSPSDTDHWPKLVTQLKLTAVTQQLAENCALERHEEDTLYLQLAPNMANLHNKRVEERLRQALEAYYDKPTQLVIRIADAKTDIDTVATRRKKEHTAWQQAAVESIENDANIKALRETFNAQLPLDSVRPLTKPEQE